MARSNRAPSAGMLRQTMRDLTDHVAARLLLLLAEFGDEVGRAMESGGGHPDLIANTPILVLASIDLHGPQRPSALQAVTGMSSGGLSKLLDRMEEMGVVRRHPGGVSGDRRGVLVELTGQGREQLRVLAAALAERLPHTRALVSEIASVLDT
jgi:DNA-binding MarR family transcriptional regulator